MNYMVKFIPVQGPFKLKQRIGFTKSHRYDVIYKDYTNILGNSGMTLKMGGGPHLTACAEFRFVPLVLLVSRTDNGINWKTLLTLKIDVCVYFAFEYVPA